MDGILRVSVGNSVKRAIVLSVAGSQRSSDGIMSQLVCNPTPSSSHAATPASSTESRKVVLQFLQKVVSYTACTSMSAAGTCRTSAIDF